MFDTNHSSINSILIIDDDEISTFVTHKCIEKSGFKGVTLIESQSEDGLKFLSSSIDNQPLLVFLDIQMPNINGFEFLEIYDNLKFSSRVEKPKLVLISSSYDDLETARESNYKDVIGYIEKPLRIDSFNEIIQNSSVTIEQE